MEREEEEEDEEGEEVGEEGGGGGGRKEKGGYSDFLRITALEIVLEENVANSTEVGVV